MPIALNRSQSIAIHLAAATAPELGQARLPETRVLLGWVARIAKGLAFATEHRRRHDRIDRLRALPDVELTRRGYARETLVQQIYWYEFAE